MSISNNPASSLTVIPFPWNKKLLRYNEYDFFRNVSRISILWRHNSTYPTTISTVFLLVSVKYSVSAMCKILKIARSTFYHDTGIAAQKEQEKLLEEQL